MNFIFFILLLLKIYVLKPIQFDKKNIINGAFGIEKDIYNKIYSQKFLNNNIFYNYPLNDDKSSITLQLLGFVINYTDAIKRDKWQDSYNCILTTMEGTTDYNPNYLNSLAFSGKDISVFGLEDECLRNNFSYYLVTYEFFRGSNVRRKLQNNSFIFFQQNTFYTGVCLPRICHNFITFLFNKTVNPTFYYFIQRNLEVRNARVYSVRNLDEDKDKTKKDPTITYDINGRYNEKKTKNERYKYIIFLIFINLILFILAIQFIVSMIVHFCYSPILNAHQLRKEKIEEKKEESEDSEDDTSSAQLFGEIKIKEQTKKSCGEKFCEILYNYFSIFDNAKFLSEKKNVFFNQFNLETIAYFRIIAMILMTFINNFEVLIKIPSRYFFYESFYTQYSTFILKFASFSVDIWLCLDGFETMYKLISYYKKYNLNRENKKNSFRYLLKFYLSSGYKLISFLLFFIIVNYCTKYFIHLLSSGPLFQYYANHIYNDRMDDKQKFKFLIPGYSLFYFYYYKCSIFLNIFISKYSLIFINEFYAYTLLIIIFYLSILLKNKFFDFFIIITNFGLYIANFWIVEFKSNEGIYYSYQLVFDNFVTTRYPHIVFNFFFLGALASLICFYNKDISSSNSICNVTGKIPFKFCYDMIKFFDFLKEKGRTFWVFFLIAIQILISLSFYFLVKLNDNTIFIPFNNLQRFVLCYESGLFVFLFCIILILIFFIRREKEGREKNYSSIIILIERTNFSFYHTINLVMYSFYCFFNFQVKLNIQNLIIVALAFFFIVFFVNLILTLGFVFPFKILNKYLIKHFVIKKSRTISESFSQASIILEKPLVRDTISSSSSG